MLQAVLRYGSIAISAIVVLSFVMFATDQTKSSSAKEVATVSDETSTTVAQQQQPPAPAPTAPKPHGEPRKTIDDLDREILKPFNGVVKSSDNEWVKKGVPSFFALVVFGFLLNLLAGYLPKPKPKQSF